jgi:hypothetical protein
MKKLLRLSEVPLAELESGDSLQHPVQQLVRSRTHAFQLAFAREAIARLGEAPENLRYEPSYKGLRILGADEQVLAEPIKSIREWYGSNAAIGPARVRYQLGPIVQEPVMSLVVRAPRQFAVAVKRDLLRRGAEAVNMEMHPTGFIAQAQATQAELLGYPAWLAELTVGRAELHLSLSHYAPIHEAPGPEAA